jgi:peroxiredoxin
MTTSVPSVADQITELKTGMAAQAPADLLAAFAAEQADLTAGGIPVEVVVPGSPMPDAPLLDIDGATTTLAEARGGRAAVIVLYRGDWCPFCNLTLAAYQQQLVPALTAKGVALLAISPQRPDGTLSMQQKHTLTYTVLSDPGNQIARALGVLSPERGDAARAASAGFGLDVAAGNADGTDRVPMPTVVVVDTEGTIRWIDVHPDYTTRSEPADILAALG